MFGDVLIIVGNSYEQDQVAEFLAALHKAQAMSVVPEAK